MNKIKQNKKKRNAGISLVCVAILLLPSISISTQLFKSDKYTIDETMQINEVMYSPYYNDTGREWIELYNYGEVLLDTTNWTFYDSGVDHEISLYFGDYETPPNGFAVICNNAIMFLIDYPEYDGTLLVSNFSLHNDGEYIAIKNAEAEIVDDLTYEALGGANNTNRSLEYDYNDIWAVSIAYCGTPNAPNSVWEPPMQPTEPVPADEEINVSINPQLSVLVDDPENDTMDVYFYDASDHSLIDIDENVESGERAEIQWLDLEYNTTYNWYVIANDTFFEIQSETWEFTTESAPENNPPYKPSNPNPEDGANDVPLDTTLSWTGGDPDGDPVTYDVYFGTTSPPEQVVNNQSETTYDPELEYSQTYYWKIVAWDDSGESTEGNIWEFATVGHVLSVEITQPEENYFYLRNMQLFGLNNKTFIYGPITIIANVTSVLDIERVEFYIEGELKETDYEAPYEFNWSQILSFKKTIKVVAYDSEGNNATDELEVFKWRLHPVLLMAGAAFVLNPNTKLIRSPRGYTIIRGFVFNPKHDGKTLTFRAVRLHYTKVRLLGTESGVIVLKKCTIKTNTPNMQLAMGPFGLFSWIFCVYKGTSLEQPRFFRAR